ncbi:alpha-amylase family glycosyl hydrolase [Stenotrophomonas lacuserhaii]|uniref:alpha-amylase family glycosyl hydrolase n=1 Tax=Stenotrophomonas lacuserhaii TaxID=2760084 RepID=UPI0015FE223B|nr:alpha-amylase family glycosyl hydrolase [Stenotrophomonas lacuserhaii]
MAPHSTAIYQLDVSLFRDGCGRGWGTLSGVVEKLDYLQWLGITHLWLLPTYRNGGRDGGYDVIDHCAIDPRIGDFDSFDLLIREATRRGIRVIVELVMQHTSDQHPWFLQARSGDARMAARYIWADSPPEQGPDPMFPPIEASVWSWDADAARFYQHRFYRHEPDLELANAEVREEMGRIIAFWLDKGVAGFRVDAVPYMVERAALADPRDEGRWLLELMRGQAAAHHDAPILIGEADVEAGEYGKYLDHGRRLSHLLDFHLNNHLFLAFALEDASQITSTLAEYNADAPARSRLAWLRNNDELDLEQLSPEERASVMDRFAPEPGMRVYERGIRRRLAPMFDHDVGALAMAHAVLLSLGQVPVLRYGDEIGLGDDLRLPERDAVRVPMQWAPGPRAGFSDGPAPPWRAALSSHDRGVASDAVNVQAQRDDPDSLLGRVRELLQARRSLPWLEQDAEALPGLPRSILGLRFRSGDSALLTLVNVGRTPQRLHLAEATHARPVVLRGADVEQQTVVLAGYGYAWLLVDSGGS